MALGTELLLLEAARDELQKARLAVKDAVATVEQIKREHTDEFEWLDNVKAIAAAAETELRQMAVNYYVAYPDHGKTIVDGIKIRETTQLQYDAKDVAAWVWNHAMTEIAGLRARGKSYEEIAARMAAGNGLFLTVDYKAFEKAAASMSNDAPVQTIKVPQATIATDLSECVKEQ